LEIFIFCGTLLHHVCEHMYVCTRSIRRSLNINRISRDLHF